jgi:hypothetical protein
MPSIAASERVRMIPCCRAFFCSIFSIVANNPNLSTASVRNGGSRHRARAGQEPFGITSGDTEAIERAFSLY